jgi:hypothetical protein
MRVNDTAAEGDVSSNGGSSRRRTLRGENLNNQRGTVIACGRRWSRLFLRSFKRDLQAGGLKKIKKSSPISVPSVGNGSDSGGR